MCIRKVLFFFSLLLIIMTGVGCQEHSGGGEFAKLYNVEVTPNEAKVGDVITYTYVLDNVHYWKAIDYNRNVTVNEEGQIEVSGLARDTYLAYLGITLDEYGKYNSQNRSKHQKITNYKSVKEELIENGAKRQITIECYVPENAKSGFFELYSDIEWGRDFIPASKDACYALFTVTE